jgi:hypothetical protein
MHTIRTRTIFTYLVLVTGALAVLVTGADHFYEYSVNQFSTVPTIGTLFLLNFIAATVVGVGLLLPWGQIGPRVADRLRLMLAVSGIGIGATSLIALWISEHSSLFGFSDRGYRTTIVFAIVSEATAVLALTAYLILADLPVAAPPRRSADELR